jgi:hypothetical protein
METAMKLNKAAILYLIRLAAIAIYWFVSERVPFWWYVVGYVIFETSVLLALNRKSNQ